MFQRIFALSMLAVFALASTSEAQVKITKKYNQIKDYTAETIDFGKIIDRDGREAKMSMFATYSTKKHVAINATALISIYVVTTNKEYRYQDNATLDILADGRRFHGKSEKYSFKRYGDDCVEQMFFDCVFKDIDGIANSSEVRGELGIDEFRLSKEQMDGLRTYVAGLKKSD